MKESIKPYIGIPLTIIACVLLAFATRKPTPPVPAAHDYAVSFEVSGTTNGIQHNFEVEFRADKLTLRDLHDIKHWVSKETGAETNHIITLSIHKLED